MKASSKNILVTVVVPVYNVEKYIIRCLESISKQTYKNIEILVVNDGTPDNSAVLAKEYAKKDKRIIVLDKENGGLSDARNYGIKKAKGEYICFIDSDDYINEVFIEDLLNKIKKDGTSIATCSMIQTNDKKEKLGVFKQDIDTVMSFETASACNKLFKLDLFNKIKFPVGLWYEDLATIPMIVMQASKISISTKAKYYYYINSNSITHSYSNYKKIMNMVEVLDKLNNFIKNQDYTKYLMNIEYVNLYHGIVSTTFRMCASKKYSKKEILKFVKNIEKQYPNIYQNEMAKTRFSTKYKFIAFLVKHRLIHIEKILILAKEWLHG